MGRHDHITCVRSDGLSAVLRPLLDDRRIVAATLVDVESGLTLDGWSDAPDLTDLDLLGAAHADLARAAAALTGEATRATTVDTGDGRHHVLLAVADPHGDRLSVAVVVAGRGRHVERARRRLATVPVVALTDGPSLRRRPVDGTWFPATAPVPVSPPVPGARAAPAAATTDTADTAGTTDTADTADTAAPPAAMVPGPAT